MNEWMIEEERSERLAAMFDSWDEWNAFANYSPSPEIVSIGNGRTWNIVDPWPDAIEPPF